jgi:glutamate 5-kinase
MSATSVRSSLREAKRVVVKVGSALLTDAKAGLAQPKIADFSAQISELLKANYEVVLVSSGAVAAGVNRLGWSERPTHLHELQAAAAVGQMGLVEAYEAALSSHGCRTAMILLTHDDLSNRERYLNARATLSQLLQLQVVPVVNENDTVATEEIRFGDNDTLSALVTNLIEADLLIILTDVEGLMDKDPRTHPDAVRVAQASSSDAQLDELPSRQAGELGRGGMVTKLSAARLAARSGAHTVIANGYTANVLAQIVDGADIGTLLTSDLTRMTARKRWIAGQLKAKGDLVVDNGAGRALRTQGVSLLAVGVVAVRGTFDRGDMIRCLLADGTVVAQGLVNYSSGEVEKLVGVRSEAFAEHIAFVAEPELVHRDNLVIS